MNQLYSFETAFRSDRVGSMNQPYWIEKRLLFPRHLSSIGCFRGFENFHQFCYDLRLIAESTGGFLRVVFQIVELTANAVCVECPRLGETAGASTFNKLPIAFSNREHAEQ